VGANVGYYTLIAARQCRNGQVFSFEPLPSNVDFLKRHLSLNHVRNVNVFEAAVGNTDGTAFFQTSSSNSMGHIASQGNLEVRLMTLDGLIRRGEAMPPDVIKMDIEGAEYDALCGAIHLLKQKRPKLFLATHGAEVCKACCGLLKDIGYELIPIDSQTIEKSSELIAL
jgi:FkbM family methyltransferase